MRNGLCVTLVLMLLTTACATMRPRSEFDDIPLPKDLTYQPQRSVVIESSTVKAAQLVYRGRLEPESLGHAMRTLLESNGWRHVTRTTEPKDGTRQVYEKGGNALELHIYEGLWFTYLTIAVSERLLTVTSRIENDAPGASGAAVSNGERVPGPATAGVDASVNAPATEQTPLATSRTTKGSEVSFVQRVRDFFSAVFSR